MVFQGMGCVVVRVQGVMSCGVKMSIRTPILPFHSPHPNIPPHIAIPHFINSSLLSSSSTTTSIFSTMSSVQFQNGSQVGVPFLGLCLKLANFGDAFKVPSVLPTPPSSINEDLVLAYLELSVRFEELREEFNHLIECHWVPLQRFSQGVLSSLSVLASAPVNEGAFVQDVEAGLCLLSLRSGMDKGIPLPSPSSPEYSPRSCSPSWSPSPPPQIRHHQVHHQSSSISGVEHGRDSRKEQGNSRRKNSKPYSRKQKALGIQHSGYEWKWSDSIRDCGASTGCF